MYRKWGLVWILSFYVSHQEIERKYAVYLICLQEYMQNLSSKDQAIQIVVFMNKWMTSDSVGFKLAAIVMSSWVLHSNVHRASGSEWLMMTNVSYFYLTTSDAHIFRNVCKQLKHDGRWSIHNMEFFNLKVAHPSVSYCWVEFDPFLHILVGNISEFL